MRTVRAAAHVHSEWSDDASWTLPDIAAAFGQRGYQVVLLSDHSREFQPARLDEYRAACAAASTPEVLLVPGIEYNDPDNLIHVPVWGDVPFYGHTPDITELLGKVSADGGIAVLAHPSRRAAWRRYDPAWTPHLVALEIWNRKYNGIAPDPHAAALARREGLREFVAIDFHTRRQFFPLAMALQLEGDVLDRDAVHRTLRAGRFEPMVGERPVRRVLNGPAARVLAVAERARRTAAPVLRGLRRT
ncbi:PHP domain-containing protein [Micromonospora sp. NPDC047548]|uniref:PHP domain-containing protein n=1 Tax=Micromonospora sp. NPDC047548 TaxID=3155624 RepID=UPI0033DFAB1F